MSDYFTTADLYRILSFIVGGYLFFVSFWVCTQSLFPKFVRAAQDTYSRPFLNAVVGLISVGALAVVLTVLQKAGQGGLSQMIGVVLGTLFLGGALAGSAGLARRIGSGMIHPSDKDQPWRRTMRGGVTLGMLLLIPIVNFATLSLVLIPGLGAFLRTWYAMRKDRKQLAGGNSDD